jgi:hypothetical protein
MARGKDFIPPKDAQFNAFFKNVCVRSPIIVVFVSFFTERRHKNLQVQQAARKARYFCNRLISHTFNTIPTKF